MNNEQERICMKEATENHKIIAHQYSFFQEIYKI